MDKFSISQVSMDTYSIFHFVIVIGMNDEYDALFLNRPISD
jgi:hypothetical protein